jgi:anti-sigma B factor antagonist
MALDITRNNDIIIVSLPRRFDGESAPVAEAELRKICVQSPVRILFDLSGTEYIASAGLRVLLSTTRLVLKAGGAVALSSLTPPVRQVFEIAGFTKIFPIFGSRDEALRSLQK